MSTDNGTCQLSFPLQGEIPSEGVLILRDIDVVGVGSERRHRLEELRKTREFILKTNSNIIPESVHAIYQAELIKTLQWLRPLKTEQGESFNFVGEQKKLFPRLFPKTSSLLGLMVHRVVDHYLQEMEWSSWLFQDHWRYFVGFLRQKFSGQNEIIEVAHWEWVQLWVEIQPFELSPSAHRELQVSPSLQVVSLTQDSSVLGRVQGMYAFVWNSAKALLVERRLDQYEAHLLDLLQEDRTYTAEQLLEGALLSLELQPSLCREDWKLKIEALIFDGIIY